MILSTLAELEEGTQEDKEVKEQKEEVEPNIETEVQEDKSIEEEIAPSKFVLEDERAFCESMRERILVLFEGFQSPNNKSIEAKVDLTLNFLEYLLAVIDERLENLDKK